MALLKPNAVGPRALGWMRAPLQSRLVLGVGYGVASVLTVLAILLAASPPQQGPLGPTSQLILTVLGFNAILIFGLIAAVTLRIFQLIDSADAGARLHMRFVRLFAVAAVAPAAVVFLFYGVLVSRGVETWFSQRVQTVVENSATVFRSYMEEQTRYLEDHVSPMALDLNREAANLQGQPGDLDTYLEALASYHGFPAAYVVDRAGQVLGRAESDKAPPFTPPPESSFRAADQNEIWADFPASDVMYAVYRLRAYADAYLYVARPLEKGIVSNLRQAESALVSYRDVAQNRRRVQTIFALSYVETALLVLVGAVWLGLAAANAISAPVARLVQAAGRVAGGDLTARVDAENDPAEIAVLSHAFNSMTHDLKVQQEALSRAREEAETRRNFIETVLAEVSAGVIGLDPEGRISVANRQAASLLALPADRGFGRRLGDVAPELVQIAEGVGQGDTEQEIDVVRGRDTRRLRVRAGQSEGGLVLTFDDITRLAAAQRNAAWRDVARRIAHEIKNPLTPIQLSAERIRRKYRKDISPAELETFDRCTDTIVRQVGDIGRMVDEFSAFARMPAPKFAVEDAAELLRAAVFAQRVASADIDVEIKEPLPDVLLMADGRMVAQALTNVLKNAAEAVDARKARSPGFKGRIVARLLLSGTETAAIEIEDNGVGLPATDRARLVEPYVTTREKGTGLGLAIVKRIMEDHGGELDLTDARGGQGALAILRLPLSPIGRPGPPARSKSKSASGAVDA